MATTGTYNFQSYENRVLVERAFGICKLYPAQITDEMSAIALQLLQMVVSDLPNTSFQLWGITKNLITPTLGAQYFVLPTETVDVRSAFYRTLSNVNAQATQAITSAGAVWDFGAGNAVGVTSVNLTWTAAEVPLNFQVSADGVTWTTVGTTTDPNTGSLVSNRAAGTYWYDVPQLNAQRYFQAVPVTGTVSISAASAYNTPSEIKMARINADSYWGMPNKAFQGRPLQFWLDRQIPPQMKVWPTPDSAAAQNVILVYTTRQMQDVGTLADSLELPPRWILAITYRLAAELAVNIPEVNPQLIPGIQQMSMALMKTVWTEERDRARIRYQPQISQYTR